MSRVGPLIVFGLTIIAGGAYWMLWDDCRSYLDNILIQDEFYLLMYWIWRVIPAILIFVAIMCLISAGIGIRRRRETVEY